MTYKLSAHDQMEAELEQFCERNGLEIANAVDLHCQVTNKASEMFEASPEMQAQLDWLESFINRWDDFNMQGSQYP